MSLQIITHKAKRLLAGLLLATLILLAPASGYAELVKMHSSIEGNRLQIVLDWTQAVSFKAMVDDLEVPGESKGHELLLSFDKAIETSDLEFLTKKTSAWLETLRTGYDTLLLQSRDKVTYKVLAEGKKIRIEIARSTPAPVEPSSDASTENDLLITFTESVLTNNRPELMHPILDKHGDDFLSPRPLLAAQLMLALKDKGSSLNWLQKAENQIQMTLDQQIELIGLYIKLDRSEKIGQTRNTRNLDQRIAQELNDSTLTQAHMEDLVYAMLELNAHDQVLPHLKQLAYQKGGDWVHPYEETLVKLGKNDELLEFFRMYIKQPGLDVEEKRRIAFSFVELNSKSDALPAFRELADTAQAESEDVEQLLFLWGPRPAREDRKWLADRAKASRNEERTLWLEHLVNAGGAREAVSLIMMEPPSRVSDNLFSINILALEELEDNKAFATALKQWMEPETNPGRLLQYGSLAEDRSHLELANTAYEKLLETHPEDKQALKRLGWNSFYLNKWKDTQKYLRPLLANSHDSWATNYYYAEAMYLEGHVAESLPFFQQTLEIIGKTPSLDTEMEITQAIALSRLGRKKEALLIYERLLKVSPTDKKLRVKYISTLMEVGDYEQAQKWLTLTAK